MKRNTAWAFAGNTTYAACQWVVFVLLVKALGAPEAGAFAYATAVTGPIFVLTNVRLRNLLATGVETAGGFADYLTARLLTTILAVLISLGAGGLMPLGPGSFAIMALMAFGRACDAFSDICHGLFQRDLDMRSAAIGLSVNGLASVAFVSSVLVVSRSLAAATAAYAGGSLVALAAWDLPRTLRRRRTDVSSSRGNGLLSRSIGPAVRLVITALPLGVSSAVGSVQANIPRYAIRFYLGAASLAQFAAISYIPMVGHLLVNATSQAALPILARDVRTSDRQYRNRLIALVCGTVTAGAAALFAAFQYGGVALSLIYGSEYAAYSSALFWLSAATIVTFASVFLGTGTTARKRFKSQLAISVVSLAVVGACATPFVREFGLIGAAWALFAGATVEFAAYACLTVRDLKTPAIVIPAVAPNPVAGGLVP